MPISKICRIWEGEGPQDRLKGSKKHKQRQRERREVTIGGERKSESKKSKRDNMKDEFTLGRRRLKRKNSFHWPLTVQPKKVGRGRRKVKGVRQIGWGRRFVSPRTLGHGIALSPYRREYEEKGGAGS